MHGHYTWTESHSRFEWPGVATGFNRHNLSVSHRTARGDVRELIRGSLPGVMAILNVTPDSFSDGGRFASAEAAGEEGARYAELGAAILDVGGESTRPRGAAYGEGAREISANEEEGRVLPVLSYLRRNLPSLPLSSTRGAPRSRAPRWTRAPTW